ncbi:MAG TPA: zinc ABC transporter substrate-binding protein [Stellaceae bacterium]|nr:zinc ABC transporter substrate-binding protein [Stellaceae bacterium]
MPRLLSWLAIASAFLLSATAHAADDVAPTVAVTVRPLHSLVAVVMAGIGKPDLVISGTATARDYKPDAGEAERLAAARLVFWVGPMLERNLVRPLALIAGATEVVPVSEAPGIVLRPPRGSGAWSLEDDAPSGSGTVSDTDGDLWLDPRNARAIVAKVASRLGAVDPVHAGHYTANAAKLYARLDALDASLQQQLQAVASWRFLVYRDNYQYFEQRYRLSASGAVLGATDEPPGPIRMEAVRHQIKLSRARCVFGEPDTPESLLDAVTDGLGVRTGTLDPEGLSLKPGPDLYVDLMNALAGSLLKCLQGRS